MAEPKADILMSICNVKTISELRTYFINITTQAGASLAENEGADELVPATIKKWLEKPLLSKLTLGELIQLKDNLIPCLDMLDAENGSNCDEDAYKYNNSILALTIVCDEKIPQQQQLEKIQSDYTAYSTYLQLPETKQKLQKLETSPQNDWQVLNNNLWEAKSQALFSLKQLLESNTPTADKLQQIKSLVDSRALDILSTADSLGELFLKNIQTNVLDPLGITRFHIWKDRVHSIKATLETKDPEISSKPSNG